MHFPRSSGILLHPTSLPGPFGIGDLGANAYRFIDFLVACRQSLWQVLPLGPTGFGNSPYLAYSALAGNPLLLSLEQLQERGLLTAEDLANPPAFPVYHVDYDWVRQFKLPLLHKACQTFKRDASAEQWQAFKEFCQAKAFWLDDYAFFMAYREANGEAMWNHWEAGIAKRKPEAMQQERDRLANEIFEQSYLQFEFFRQWSALKQYANEHHVQIIGDIPIYVAHDSADVWANSKNFCLDEETGNPALMAGVPPDYFSATGQLWGNPVYDWEYLQAEDFRWWIQRFSAILDYVDIIRIDHFRGFRAYWAVPGGETTAMSGEWVNAPGDVFFKRLNETLGKLPIIAEDLGIITPDVEALRDQFEFPGMKILQFAFDSGSGNPYLPHSYPTPNCVVYTGTHDNNTTVGWFGERAHDAQDIVRQYLGSYGPFGIQWDLIRLAWSSVANQAIIPLQDLLGLGTDCRMNLPSSAEGNWEWRYLPEGLTPDLGDRLRWMTEIYGRCPQG